MPDKTRAKRQSHIQDDTGEQGAATRMDGALVDEPGGNRRPNNRNNSTPVTMRFDPETMEYYELLREGTGQNSRTELVGGAVRLAGFIYKRALEGDQLTITSPDGKTTILSSEILKLMLR